MKIVTKFYLSVGLILVVFLFVTITYIRQSKETEKQINTVLTSTENLRQLESYNKLIVDMETGLRGFLIGDKEVFLESYFAGKKNLIFQYSFLKKKNASVHQSQLLSEIDSLINSWDKTFALPLISAKRNALANPNNPVEQRAYTNLLDTLVKPGKGKHIMDQIRLKFKELNQLENEFKDREVQLLEARLDKTRMLFTLLITSAILFGIITTYFLGRTIKKRLTSMVNLAKDISGGNFETNITDNTGDEMSELATSLNAMSIQLKQSFNSLTKTNKELDQFAYVVSHDLKAPLRAINNLSEWMLEDYPDIKEEMRTNLGLMRSRAHRMENLINGILDYARIGRKQLNTTSFQVRELLEEIIDSLASPENVKINLPANLPALTTEKILLHQVFGNLISNAIKYNDKPIIEITISYKPLSDSHQFAVSDNGPGIPTAFKEKVFGIFQTMEARDTKESTGIGLSIVKKIITEKEGSIWIEDNDPEPGVTFLFTWPKIG